MKIDFQRALLVASLFCLGCGVDRLQHVMMPDGGVEDAAVEIADSGAPDAGTIDAGQPDAGAVDAGIPDSGTFDAGPVDAGEVDAGVDAGATDSDAGSDAGPSCTSNGVSPELAALSGGPYQNCQGGTIPRTDFQAGTQAFSGCCGELVRVCAVTGYSTQNAMYCR